VFGVYIALVIRLPNDGHCVLVTNVADHVEMRNSRIAPTDPLPLLLDPNKRTRAATSHLMLRPFH